MLPLRCTCYPSFSSCHTKTLKMASGFLRFLKINDKIYMLILSVRPCCWGLLLVTLTLFFCSQSTWLLCHVDKDLAFPTIRLSAELQVLGKDFVCVCVSLPGLPLQRSTHGAASTTGIYSLTVLEARSLRQRCRRGWLRARSPWLAVGRVLPVTAQGLPSVSRSLPPVLLGGRPSRGPHFPFIASVKPVAPKTVTFGGTGG